MLLTVGKIARQEGLTEGYRLVVNDGEMAGKNFDKRIKRCLFCLKRTISFPFTYAYPWMQGNSFRMAPRHSWKSKVVTLTGKKE